jgi:hypothetical protein
MLIRSPAESFRPALARSPASHTTAFSGSLSVAAPVFAIPTKRNRCVQVAFDAAIYALRNWIARAIGHRNNARRFAICYNKGVTSYLGLVNPNHNPTLARQLRPCGRIRGSLGFGASQV